MGSQVLGYDTPTIHQNGEYVQYRTLQFLIHRKQLMHIFFMCSFCGRIILTMKAFGDGDLQVIK